VDCEYLLFIFTKGAQRLIKLEIFAFVLVLAALCHDFDRLGFTNAFLVVANDFITL
jgi:hypothetical protein